MMGLPDELWRQILDTGILTSKLGYKDLCSVSISCRTLHRLSDEDSLWSRLISSDFPCTSRPQPQNPNRPPTSVPAKSTYRIRFEKDRERRFAAHRRAVLRKESGIWDSERKIKVIKTQLLEEADRMRAASTELSNLRKARQASVALNVWQPEVIRGRQKQIVQQCAVPVQSRVHSLEMELSLCQKQIAGLEKACRDEKRVLEKAKKELASLKYHPLRDYSCTRSHEDNCNRVSKKLKTSVNYVESRRQLVQVAEVSDHEFCSFYRHKNPTIQKPAHLAQLYRPRPPTYVDVPASLVWMLKESLIN